MIKTKQQNLKRAGFTLVEVLIVVVILGILAATVLPQFTSASTDAKESSFLQDLQTLRGQIQLYKYQHAGKYPADGSTDTDDFRNALLLSSDKDGTTGAVGTKPFGPYLIGNIPPNPFTGGSGIMIVSDVAGTTPDESAKDGTEIVGWIYNPATGEIKGNNSGKTSDGRALDSI
ncbi:prepilin-type N-terminal cleavage/methylation domain-containing protein [Gimesia aquarii]|uniref:Type II secretion system protein G n=1 Tax=Gimesia aquarii TaxID=2527964 RepID=A0A517VPI6_9PLAN|nr:prepilin-type N-terminal cleavage/methylation domain-containing protein [Gimesia aquarii]QDT94922.1 Type II secretion system protein G precursor [Gimesia aquarii]